MSRISHSTSRKGPVVTTESLAIDHDMEDSVQSSLAPASVSSDPVSVLTEEDPVEILKKLRKNRLTKGIKGTAKAVKGAVSKGTYRMARGARGASKRNDDNYDVEQAATETDPLIPKESSPQKRSGKALWEILRNRRDEIIFMQHDQHEDDQESVASRKSRYQQEIVNEIRNALEFSLPQCLVAILVYLFIAVLAYSFVFEQWSIVDACYFAVVSFTTIGYGDIVPTTDASRLFTAFFALSGVACLGIALGVLGSNLVEAHTKAIDQASQLSRYQVMSLFDSSSKISNNLDARQPSEIPKSPWYQCTFVRQVFPLFTCLFIFCWFLGNDAGWDAVETFYFCVITGTTVGFGDYSPQTQTGRLFAVPIVLLAVSILGSWLSAVADAIIEFRQASFRERFQARELTIADLEVMDADEDGKVSLAEYLSFMLVSMQAVDQGLIDNLTAQFERLDVDGTGSLEKEDLMIVAKRKLHSTKRKIELSEYKQHLLRAGGSSYQEEKSSALMSAISSQLR